jgi:carbon storage regulator
MLVLSRTVTQEIMIGDNIRIMVIEIRDGKVRLGITAPRDVPVHRHEIYEAIQRLIQQTATATKENTHASSTTKTKDGSRANLGRPIENGLRIYPPANHGDHGWPC